MRDRLASIADKSREEFETTKRQLEAEMSRGRENIGKIQKGLRNNEIIDQPIAAEISNGNSETAKRRPKRSQTAVTKIEKSTDVDSSEVVMVPSGSRVSDWCFIGAIDSTPPVVKSAEVYESIRLLGRGSFGDVFLVKNVDDNRLLVKFEFQLPSQLIK